MVFPLAEPAFGKESIFPIAAGDIDMLSGATQTTKILNLLSPISKLPSPISHLRST